MSVRVCTYNVHWGIGMDGRRSLARVADVIGRIDPDVIAVQELDRTRRAKTDYEDQFTILRDRLGMDAAYATTIERAPTEESGGESRRYGHAIFTTGTIETSKTHSLPGPTDAEPRALLEAHVALDDGTVPIFAVHLGVDPDERVEQVHAILDRVPSRAEADHVLLGDLNAEPGSEPYHLLVDEGPYLDAVAAVDAADPTYPSPYAERDPENEYVDDHVLTYVPRKRIDHAFVTPGIEPIDGTVRRSLASDHSPVIADLDFVSSPTKP